MQLLEFTENGIYLTFGITDSQHLVLLNASALPFDPAALEGLPLEEFQPVEVMITGENRPEDRLGNKMIHSAPGYRLRYESHSDIRNSTGRKLEFRLTDAQTASEVTLHYQFFDTIAALRCWTVVTNTGSTPLGLECVSSFSLHGFERQGLQPYEEKMKLGFFHNGWQKELSWGEYTLPELGLSRSQEAGKLNSSITISAGNVGNWSTKEYLPMAYLENQESGERWCWQIEHNGSWHWELGEHGGALYLKLSGPDELNAHWWKQLAPGESFTSVPVGIVFSTSGFDHTMAELTRYRRAIRRPNRDNETMPIIFNDYMNCLWGNPTTENELPLIEAAAKAGCEYYCIDCGWYSDGRWWDGVGEWLPSPARFPNGLGEVMEAIRAKGMVPGLWLELEVMGLKCPLAERVSRDWFFQRHGRRVRDKSRYQLDFRNPEAAAYADGVIDRLVRDFGIGYIKMDYNIEPGIGTDRGADSAGDGLLEHNRAYLAWLDGVFVRHPELVIENCSSGGMRMDYAMLSRYSIQSTSDVEDYRAYSTISANAPAALTPEQAAVWSYPMEGCGAEETIFNMVNTMLLRVHQSGHLARIDAANGALVAEGIAYYKATRADRADALPFWPLGPANYSDPWAAVGLRGKERLYLAVWRRSSYSSVCELPLPAYRGKELHVCCAYPVGAECACRWNPDSGLLTVSLPAPMTARLFELEFDTK